MSGGTYLGMPAFPKAASESTQNLTLRGNLRHATHTIRDKRAKAVAELDDWAGCAPPVRRSRTVRCATWTTIWSRWRRR